jgi:paraquat-inducible protein A
MARWIACHDCDLVHRDRDLPPGGAAKCSRCEAVLYRERQDGLNRALALTIAGLVLFVVANTFPFLSFHMQGQVTETTLATGVWDLYEQGKPELAGLVFVTAIVAPAFQLGLLLHMLLPLQLGRRPPGLAYAFRLLRRIQPWSMMEVFLLGILVSVVKLAGMAKIVPGLAIYSFAVLIIVVAGANSVLEPRMIWRRAEEVS